MDRTVAFVSLQHQDAGSFRIFWIVLEYLTLVNSSKNLADQNTIGGELVVAML